MRTKVLMFLIVAVVLISCEKEEEQYIEYFEGRVNGKEFRPDGNFYCTAIYGSYYREGYLDFEEGYLTYIVKNCATDEKIVLGKLSNLREGVFTSLDSTDTERPRCVFSDWSAGLSARQPLEIRLEITNIEHIDEFSQYFIEGRLDAVVQDTILDSTVVVSDVKFGHKFISN